MKWYCDGYWLDPGQDGRRASGRPRSSLGGSGGLGLRALQPHDGRCVPTLQQPPQSSEGAHASGKEVHLLALSLDMIDSDSNEATSRLEVQEILSWLRPLARRDACQQRARPHLPSIHHCNPTLPAVRSAHDGQTAYQSHQQSSAFHPPLADAKISARAASDEAPPVAAEERADAPPRPRLHPPPLCETHAAPRCLFVDRRPEPDRQPAHLFLALSFSLPSLEARGSCLNDVSLGHED